ncbi:hypothetical protein KNP414_00894 [Paenibacillus mucilaginosus KNP414]|uniref:Uncharacterized protein n=1 Tax=Paenibacillus mucilaginosus (strain KNP414) TaxID=1036673 RepID=F8F7J9_PAEMK|nr:hypothetical protein KNP414_00894 [Paenibacillus mucilaginosus KNP414]
MMFWIAYTLEMKKNHSVDYLSDVLYYKISEFYPLLKLSDVFHQ